MMKRYILTTIVFALPLLSACGDEDSARQYTVTLTGIDAVKQGSEEGVPIDGMPVEGATLTIDGS